MMKTIRTLETMRFKTKAFSSYSGSDFQISSVILIKSVVIRRLSSDCTL